MENIAPADREVYGPQGLDTPYEIQRKLRRDSLSFDLNKSNPLEDLVAIFFYPKKFFQFFILEKDISRYVLIKSLAGALFFAWLASFWNPHHPMRDFFLHMINGVDPKTYAWLETNADMGGLKESLMALVLVFENIRLFVAPVISLGSVFLSAAIVGAMLGLFGVRKESLPTTSALVAFFAYVHWYAIWALVAGLGMLLKSLSIFLVPIYFIRKNYGLSFYKALLCTQILNFIVFLLIVLFCGGALVALAAI